MIGHVLATAASLAPQSTHVVYNPDTPEVQEADASGNVAWVPQEQRLGTGHAVQQAMPNIPDDAQVLVLYADTPLVPVDALKQLVEAGRGGLALLSMVLEFPSGYGRVLRDAQGLVTAIVEEGDADPTQREIREVNTGILAAPAGDLRAWLDGLGDDNSQGEIYLTDVFAAARATGQTISSIQAADPSLLQGANDRVQLAELEARYRRLRATELMLAGVSITDPARVDLRGAIEAGRDVSIDVNVVLEGGNTLGEGTIIGPGCVLRGCDLAAGTRVHPYSVLEGVRTLGACDIGPFARVRPGTELARDSRVGNFVEVKNARLGEGSKASHLSYIGDSEIGRDVNIGAGTITCNYDGVNKHRTVIEDGVFVGSDTQLVAPVTVGKGATIGAGTTVTRDVPEGQLTVSRAKQVTVKGWTPPGQRQEHGQ